MGGIDGPADKIYSRLPNLLREHDVSSLRIEYRRPNDLEECVLDVLAGCSFLKGIGATDAVLVGHSFGGAVVISAAELAPLARGVVSMSPQLHGTRTVENIDMPLLLVHGMADTILSHEASEDIYRRAREPKRIVLYAEAGHSLIQAREDITTLLLEWIPATLEGRPPEGGRTEVEHSGEARESGETSGSSA
jgi:alpha-beta hydrolase superfamily lysophospholipase